MPAPTIAKKDAWAKKTWFKVNSPAWLGGKTITETPAARPQDLVGRTLTVPLNELTGNMRHFQTEIALKIQDVSGDVAQTEYTGQEVMHDVVARLVRRWSSRIDLVEDIKTADGKRMRLKILAITQRRVNTTLQGAVRNEVTAALKEFLAGKTVQQIVSDINLGKAMKSVIDRARKVYPMRAVEVRKIEVL